MLHLLNYFTPVDLVYAPMEWTCLVDGASGSTGYSSDLRRMYSIYVRGILFIGELKVLYL